MVSAESTDVDYFEWEHATVMSRIYTEANSGSTTIDGSATSTALDLTGITGLEEGAIIKNATRATPIGTYGVDELMEVTAINASTNVCTLVRDVARQGTVAGQGSTAHVLTDTYEVVYTPKEEGSTWGENKYSDVTLTGNYTNIVDFALMVTGTQIASKRILSSDSLQNQFDNQLKDLQRQLEGMLFYGCLNNGANAGSDSYVRRTKGLQNYVAVSGGIGDYSTKDVTEAALNNLIYDMLTANADETDPYIIATHPFNWGKIQEFGSDKVTIGQTETRWGRSIDTWKSKWGIEFPLLWSLNIKKSDLFIVDLRKIAIVNFRPFEKAVLGFKDDGVDAHRERYLGELGVKVVDPTVNFAYMSYLPWS